MNFDLDVLGLQRGIYSDRYFVNIAAILGKLALAGYTFRGHYPNCLDSQAQGAEIGNLEVEMQWFTRRQGQVVVCGIDESVEMLRAATGYFDGAGQFANTFEQMEIEAVRDGDLVHYEGNNPLAASPVLKVRGRYRDFAHLETSTLGTLARCSRVATNVYQTLQAAQGKPVLFFPARFDLYETQKKDGYAYWVAVNRYNKDTGRSVTPFVSTDAQGAMWGGKGGGTMAHAMIACFLGDTTESALAFARFADPTIRRIVLVDFNNDVVRDSLRTARAMFDEYRLLKAGGCDAEAEKYVLYGVRLDTSGNMIDNSLIPTGMRDQDYGVNERLVTTLREALDNAWATWGLRGEDARMAEEYCKRVKIVVSGGFRPEKIRRFESNHVPVDIYAVGSYLIENSSKDGTNTDYTADVVRVKLDGKWMDMAKVGRGVCHNTALAPVAA